MYQTVGHDAIHLIAEAMGLPLYRSTITGQALNQTATYGSRLPQPEGTSTTADDTRSDETEDLYRLLRQVKAAHPQANAVSVGAILSNYQRVRVEHVALRCDLQLVPLSFLWQRDQAHLLADMCGAGMESVVIKVAGAGLEERDLGKSLRQMQPKLHTLVRGRDGGGGRRRASCSDCGPTLQHRLYGAHICGEGGEYETFTLDCPLFRRRIVL